MPDELLLFLETRDRLYCFRCLRQAFPHEAVRERIENAARRSANSHRRGALRDLPAGDDRRCLYPR